MRSSVTRWSDMRGPLCLVWGRSMRVNRTLKTRNYAVEAAFLKCPSEASLEDIPLDCGVFEHCSERQVGCL